MFGGPAIAVALVFSSLFQSKEEEEKENLKIEEENRVYRIERQDYVSNLAKKEIEQLKPPELDLYSILKNKTFYWNVLSTASFRIAFYHIGYLAALAAQSAWFVLKKA